MTVENELRGIVPRIEDYFGVWAIEPGVGSVLSNKVQSMDLVAHAETVAASSRKFSSKASDYTSISPAGVGLINVEGVMQTREASAYASTATPLVRAAVKDMAANPQVKAIALLIDSPGGMASGIPETAQAIADAKAIKPVYALGENLVASAAYWLMAQATEAIVSPSSSIGSIGVYTVVQDTSAAAAMEGVKVHVIRSSDLKGAGIPGTPVTDAYLQHIQTDLVNPTAEAFASAVQSGRQLSADQLANVANGKLWKAQAAKQLGLVDQIMSADVFLADLEAKLMAENAKTKAATAKELRAEFPHASESFLFAQVEAEATVDEARVAYIKFTEAALEKERAERAQSESQLKAEFAKQLEESKTAAELAKKQADEAVKTKVDAVDGLNATGSADADEITSSAYRKGPALRAFEDAIESRCKLVNCSRAAAVSWLEDNKPSLRQAVLKEAGVVVTQRGR